MSGEVRMDDAVTTPIEILDGGAELIPTKHAIATALRRIKAGWQPDSDRHWTRIAWTMIKRNRLNVDAVRTALTQGMQADNLVTITEIRKRRASKTTTVFDVMRMCPDDFVAQGEDCAERFVVMRRETCEVHRRNLEYRSCIAGIALHEHAIGRLYEREQLAHGEIIARLKEDLARIETSTAFAHAAGLMSSSDGDTRTPGATGMIPLGQGLLIVRSVEVEARNASTARIDLVELGAIRMAGEPHPQVVSHHVVDGLRRATHRITIGITYLAYEDLRPEQRDYLALFEDAMLDHDLASITSDVGRLWMPHERPVPMPRIEVDARLHEILRRNVRIDPSRGVYMTKEWRDGDRTPPAPPHVAPGHHHLNPDTQRQRLLNPET